MASPRKAPLGGARPSSPTKGRASATVNRWRWTCPISSWNLVAPLSSSGFLSFVPLSSRPAHIVSTCVTRRPAERHAVKKTSRDTSESVARASKTSSARRLGASSRLICCGEVGLANGDEEADGRRLAFRLERSVELLHVALAAPAVKGADVVGCGCGWWVVGGCTYVYQ